MTVTSEEDTDNRAVAFSEAGLAIAYLHRNSDAAERRSELANGVWGAPQTIPTAEADGASYSVTAGPDDLQVTPLHPRVGESAPPPLWQPRCEGY